jgi:hypothetical protein
MTKYFLKEHLFVSEINCNESIQVIAYQKQLLKHLYLPLCNLGNLFWRFLNVDKLDTRLG